VALKQATTHTNSGELIAWPTENGVSPLPPLKSASNVNIMIGTGYLIRSIYLSKYGDDNIFLWMLSKCCYTREKNKHMRAAKEASITPNRDTTRGKNLTGGSEGIEGEISSFPPQSPPTPRDPLTTESTLNVKFQLKTWANIDWPQNLKKYHRNWWLQTKTDRGKACVLAASPMQET
jgi:hypothetical protein